ncbi:MAG TPA: LysM peptidoglycan-binding domain-containing protein [Anaerolineales bacterium]|nr:LysM peptidoglycan-binding domain-containing protein [Anaerolineales bacterium]
MKPSYSFSPFIPRHPRIGGKFTLFWVMLALFLLFLPVSIHPAQAQDTPPESGPVYIVQSGDTLWTIAQRFGVSMDGLAQANGITDPNQLLVGMRLVIPGLEGLSGVLTTTKIPFGESLRSLSSRYRIPSDLLIRLNKWTNPEFTAAGASLVIPLPEGGEALPDLQGDRATLKAGQSLLELAARHGVNPWLIMGGNEIPANWAVFPGETLYLPGTDTGPGAMPRSIAVAIADDLPVIQGRTIAVKLTARSEITLSGEFAGKTLNFFQTGDGGWAALQGVHAMLDPGYYPLTLSGTLADGTPFSFLQMMYVQEGNYPYDPPLVVDSETVDVKNTRPEELQWAEITAPVTPQRHWSGIFAVPVPDYYADCYPSRFGNRRSYNGSAYEFFHTGLDFCGQVGTEIYAAASGVVVFAESTTIHGNATVIDHGWGIYTAYAHQSEMMVSAGDPVEKGQLIGRVGVTGRVSGPHLHWEVIVGGVQVDPLQWLERVFP